MIEVCRQRSPDGVWVRSILGSEPLPTDELVDLDLAKFDRETAHSLASPLAVPPHALRAGEISLRTCCN
jgi:hypothetical protein